MSAQVEALDHAVFVETNSQPARLDRNVKRARETGLLILASTGLGGAMS